MNLETVWTDLNTGELNDSKAEKVIIAKINLCNPTEVLNGDKHLSMELPRFGQQRLSRARQCLSLSPACKVHLYVLRARGSVRFQCAAMDSNSRAGGESLHFGGGSPVGRILQQHRRLMEAGFTYDQASLVLQVTQHGSPLGEGMQFAWQRSKTISSCKILWV